MQSGDFTEAEVEVAGRHDREAEALGLRE